MAHAEASARTIEAAVTAAAGELGLRADQVDVEVLEEPVPSTFGYIGSPARVRVTPTARSGQGGEERAAGARDPGESAVEGAQDATATQRSGPVAGSGSVSSAGVGSESVAAGGSDPVPSGGSDPVPSAATAGAPVSAATSPATGSPSTSAPTPEPTTTVDQAASGGPNGPDRSNHSEPSDGADSPSAPDAGIGPAIHLASDEPVPSAGTQPAGVAASSSGQPSSTTATGSNGDRGTERDGAATPSSRSASSTDPNTRSESPGTPRSSRRTYRDEPIDPAVVEADTERGGDFLEGLLDALDVDGDITTWVDEAGGHIDLEGSDLDVLVGSNGETLDALQELTRLAVLRQSKRRVRLLLDINGFRARQREQLVSMVKATAEQVIRTREDHEFQPMTPAERKIVHDAVAAIDGARTESLGEDPHRRVVIRPA